MGRTDVNEHIGLQEDIGPIAAANQATCRSDGCTKVVSKCVREDYCSIENPRVLPFFRISYKLL